MNQQGNVKESAKSYWTKRAVGFRRLRAAELESKKANRWEQELLGKLMTEKWRREEEGENHFRVLDLGCGCGFFSILLEKHGFQVTAIDLTEAMIEEGKMLAREVGCVVDFRVMDAEKLDFSNQSFDAIVTRNLTWNLPNPDKAYAEWLRVLKKGGILLNYDAEYGKHKNGSGESKINAHSDISEDLVKECETMYQMLPITNFERPNWDYQILKSLGVKEIKINERIGTEIYREKDQFYIPDSMFGIFVRK